MLFNPWPWENLKIFSRHFKTFKAENLLQHGFIVRNTVGDRVWDTGWDTSWDIVRNTVRDIVLDKIWDTALIINQLPTVGNQHLWSINALDVYVKSLSCHEAFFNLWIRCKIVNQFQDSPHSEKLCLNSKSPNHVSNHVKTYKIKETFICLK